MTFPRTDRPRRSCSCAVALMLALVAASSPAPAASPDPLQSDACRGALASLQAEETAQVSPPGGGAGRASPPTPSRALQDARRNAARRCLSRRADVDPPPGRFAVTPIVVEPLGSNAASAPAAGPHAFAPLRVAPSRPVAIPAPPGAVVSCDVGGCWANDGSRLPRVGPVLWGPHGACTVQGASLQCP